MKKRLAAAVLYAVVSFMGATNLDSTPFETDDDTDADIECVEFRRLPDGAHQTDVLSLASVLAGQRIDDAWVVHGPDGTSGAAAIHQLDPHIALVSLEIDRDGAPPVDYRKLLLVHALDSCREMGALKVIVDAGTLPLSDLKSVAASRGFQFHRTQNSPDATVHQFYTNIYWRNPRIV
jgi:hypothetical protein